MGSGILCEKERKGTLFKVTSHLQRPKKSFFFFYLAKLKLVILSSVYKRKILKISKSGRVI